jgi:3-oxoacyl-[acyl-carrier protein] reductase
MKVLVVGASGTIGQAIVDELSNDETNIVIATSRSGEQIQGENRTNVHFYALDLSDSERARNQITRIMQSELNLDAIVIASGILKTSFSLVAENEMEQIQINFLRVIEMLKILIRKYLKRELKSIVLIASTSATNSDGGRLGYSSSKAALIAAGKTLARELGPKGIRVNSVSPGLIESEMVKSTIDNQELDSLKARLFLKRLGYAEEVAKVIHFLVSNDSSYITGQNIFVDGGMSW